MWVTENKKTGKYVFNDMFKNPLTGKWKHVSVTYGKNTARVRKDAQIELNKKIEKKLQELQSGNSNITLSQLVKKYFELAKDQLAEATLYRKQHTLATIVEDLDGQTIARKIKPTLLNKYFDSLLYEKKLANATVQSYRSCLSAVYEYGIRYGYLTENPVTNSRPTYKNERAKKNDEIENKYLTDAELQKI